MPAGDADIIVFSGGSSVGDRDLHRGRRRAAGEMVFHGIAVKPGKPTMFGTVAGTPFFGMPGNPTSCLSNAFILLVPVLRATARLPLYAPRTLRAPAGPSHRVADGPAPVLYRAASTAEGAARLQGIRRHHEPVAGGWLHRDPRR